MRVSLRVKSNTSSCARRNALTAFSSACAAIRPPPPIRQPDGPTFPISRTLLRLIGLDDNRAFALSGNSTSLVALSVSALNPRIILFPRVSDTLERPKELIAAGFVRGEQFVEVVSRDLETKEPRFYLVSFEQD